MWRVVCAGLAGALACGHSAEIAPQQRDHAKVAAAPAAPADAASDAEAPEEERLAAIEKAMNELRGAAQTCWATAATERFDIEGELTFQISIAADRAEPVAVHDTARNTRLTSCVLLLLARYPWAPPLRGQTIQLPFQFRAPDGQSTINRGLVTWNEQRSGHSRVAVGVLLDENNTGNDAASMFEIAIAADGATGLRRADRPELWYFLLPGEVVMGGTRRAVGPGDMMYVPKGAARGAVATRGDFGAVIVMVPGGREGAARGGALPTREVTSAPRSPSPIVLPAAAARTQGPVTIYADPTTIRDQVLSASIVTMPASARLDEHVHAGETELWYMLEGEGTLTVNGVELPVTRTSVIQIPKNTRHALTVTADIRALQIFTPAGPEQRFKARP